MPKNQGEVPPELDPSTLSPEERARYLRLAVDTEIFEQMAAEQAKKPVRIPFNLFSSNKNPKNPSPNSH